MLHKRKENRIWQDKMKAKRKQKISRSVYNRDWYSVFGRYKKGKIHDAREKTCDSANKSRGPVDGHRKLCRLAVTHCRYGKKNYKPTDKRKVDAMNDRLTEMYV